MTKEMVSIKTARKSEMREIADSYGISISELLERYMALGFAIDKYMDADSRLMIHSPKGLDRDLLIPVTDLIRQGLRK